MHIPVFQYNFIFIFFKKQAAASVLLISLHILGDGAFLWTRAHLITKKSVMPDSGLLM